MNHADERAREGRGLVGAPTDATTRAPRLATMPLSPCLCLVRQTVHHTASSSLTRRLKPVSARAPRGTKKMWARLHLFFSLSLSLSTSLSHSFHDHHHMGVGLHDTRPALAANLVPCARKVHTALLVVAGLHSTPGARNPHPPSDLSLTVCWITPSSGHLGSGARQAGAPMPGAPTLDHPPPHDSATQDRTQKNRPHVTTAERRPRLYSSPCNIAPPRAHLPAAPYGSTHSRQPLLIVRITPADPTESALAPAPLPPHIRTYKHKNRSSIQTCDKLLLACIQQRAP